MQNRISICFLGVLLLLGFKPQAQKTILWEIRKGDAKNVSYLLGTYHQMGNSFVDSLPIIKDKLIHADVAIFESIGDPGKLKALFNQRPNSDEIDKIFSEEEMVAIVLLAKDWGVDVHKLRPMELFVKLQQEYFKNRCGSVLPTDVWDHFDNYLISIAKTNNRKIMAFETDSIQTAAINMAGGDWKELKKPILQWVKNSNEVKAKDKICEETRNYMAFRLNYNFKESCGGDVILQERNEKWMQQLPNLLDSNNCFISVGLFHLFRSCGLIEQLRGLGYSVTPVNIK